MTLNFIATIIEEIYYVGRVKIDHKLQVEDFQQFARTAYASLLRNLYFNLKHAEPGTELYFVSNLLRTKKFSAAAADNRGRRHIDITNHPMIVMPKNAHLFAVVPIGPDDCECGEPSMVLPGEERYYNTVEFEHIPFYIPKENEIVGYHFPECITEFEVEGAWDDDKANIPADIAFDIINQVLGITLKVAGFPIDKTDNNDPNVTTVKQRLQAPEGI